MSRTNSNWPVWLNSWVFVYELNGCRFKSRCSHLIFRYGACFKHSFARKKDYLDKNWKLFTSKLLGPHYLHHLKQLKIFITLISIKTVQLWKYPKNWVLSYLSEMWFARSFKTLFKVFVSAVSSCDYVRSLQGMFIISAAVYSFAWKVFWKTKQHNPFLVQH